MTQREPRIQDAKHLAFVRLQPCCVCGTRRMVEAAHVRMACPARGKRSTGMAEKPSDCWTVPLCAYHHRTGPLAQHTMSEHVFWKLVGLDPFEIALRLWAESGGADREPKPRKQKAIKPRDPDKPRRKIIGRTQIVSRPFEKQSRPFVHASRDRT